MSLRWSSGIGEEELCISPAGWLRAEEIVFVLDYEFVPRNVMFASSPRCFVLTYFKYDFGRPNTILMIERRQRLRLFCIKTLE